MYYCDCCKKKVKNPLRCAEPSEAWGHTVWETYLVCPECEEPVEDYCGQDEEEDNDEV